MAITYRFEPGDIIHLRHKITAKVISKYAYSEEAYTIEFLKHSQEERVGSTTAVLGATWQRAINEEVKERVQWQ